MFQRGNQSVSRTCKIIIVGIILFLVISLILSFVQVLEPLDFLYFCSYVKLFITLIKYVPQAYLNFRRKSTLGWSIGNILLDFTGGFLSIIQMFIIAYNESEYRRRRFSVFRNNRSNIVWNYDLNSKNFRFLLKSFWSMTFLHFFPSCTICL